MRLDWLATNVYPAWAPGHLWTTLTARRVTAEIRAGGLVRACAHVKRGAPDVARRVVDLAAGATVCRQDFPGYVDTLPAAFVTTRPCDACLTRAATVTAFIRPVREPGVELLVALCDMCVVDGPVVDE